MTTTPTLASETVPALPTHPRPVVAGGWRGYRLPQDRPFKRWFGVRERSRRERQARCPHPATRAYGGNAADGVLWFGCCACGALLYDSINGSVKGWRGYQPPKKQQRKTVQP